MCKRIREVINFVSLSCLVSSCLILSCLMPLSCLVSYCLSYLLLSLRRVFKNRFCPSTIRALEKFSSGSGNLYIF